MDFHFTPEQEQFRDAVRGFAERHLRDGALKPCDKQGRSYEITNELLLIR